MAFTYTLEARDQRTAARAGRMRTGHGDVLTPAFMPVGTAGSVKTLTPDEVASSGADILLANTYHLSLRPGAETVRRMGGLHRFMGWPGAILTDSGGFQVMSLSPLRTVTEDGVEFRSHLDGSRQRLTPEEAIRIQDALGSDIAMSLDELVESPAPENAVAEAVDRTVAWAARGLEERRRLAGDGREWMALFGINQGGTEPAERGASRVWRRCPSRGSRWAGSGWERAGSSGSRWWSTIAACFPKRGRAISWGWDIRSTWWKRWRAESTCSTACCPRATRGAARCSSRPGAWS
jgi:queuine tRNA-ribosyltransferase